MKITYITTMSPSNENRRIREEVLKMGNKWEHIDLRNLKIVIEDGKLKNNRIINTDADIVILRGIMSSLKTISALTSHIRKKGIKVFDNSFLEHEYSISKVTDMVKLTLNNIKVPDTYHLKNFEDYEKAVVKLGYPVVIKSNKMGKGKGVYKIDTKEDMDNFVSLLQENEKKAGNYIIQKFIPYKYDIRALIIGKKLFAMRRIPGKGEFRANFSLGGGVELFDLDRQGKELAFKALKAVDMSVGGVDILIDAIGNRYVLEVNHNPGFTGMEKATGVNIAKIYLDHAISHAK